MDKPILYLAPMEGITNYIYRNAFHKYFGHTFVDKYYTPFLVPRGKGKTMSEQREVEISRNSGIKLIPQVLTDSPELFVAYAEPLREMGYDEINLNFGCPSGTVTSKGRGAAILTRKDVMHRILDQACSVSGIRISVKTRLGMEDPEEFYQLLELYNEYHLEELIIHARVKTEMYSGTPHIDMFGYALEHSANPVVYNGDIWTVEDYQRVCRDCQSYAGGNEAGCRAGNVENNAEKSRKCKGSTGNFGLLPAMLGRGAIADPWLFAKICGDDSRTCEQAYGFIMEVEEGYREILSGDSHLLARMKEVWTWYIRSFPNNDKIMKKLLKTRSLEEFRELEKMVIFG